MSSPPRRRLGNSPIRYLEERSPPKPIKLQTIMEEEMLDYHSRGLLSQNSSLMAENNVLAEKMKNFADESHHFHMENSRLRRENDILKEKNYVSNNIEQDRLQRELIIKDAELEKTRNDMEVLKDHYRRELDQARAQNQGLKNQVVLLERRNFAEVTEIKDRYTAMAVEDSNLARKAYLEDLKKVMENLQSTKALLAQKDFQFNQLSAMSQNLSKQYGTNLEHLIAENNLLRNRIMTVEINKDNQVREAESKKQLEKSRTHGILSYCKENNAYIEKEVKRLAQQLLEKTISIDGFTKQILKQKKNMEQTEKRYEDKIERLERNCSDRVREAEETIKKAEKHQKEEIADMKKKQMQLIETIARLQHENDTIDRELIHTRGIVSQKMNELEEVKKNLSLLHEEHAQQISKVMTDSRIKRKSMKNLSSSVSSLKQLSADGLSTSKRFIQRQNSILEGEENVSGGLHVVPEEMTSSHFVGGAQDDDVDMKELVLHYEEIILGLKKNKETELSLANDKIEKLNQSVREKQQQVLDILERFSPLMEYKLNSGSLESERKQKIQKHYKANIDILSVLLDKYQIAALKK